MYFNKSTGKISYLHTRLDVLSGKLCKRKKRLSNKKKKKARHLDPSVLHSRHISRLYVSTLRRYFACKPTCLLFAAFLSELWFPLAPSMLLKTLMKSFFETDDSSLARCLSDFAPFFTFSSTFFWCVLTALNNCTTPLGW